MPQSRAIATHPERGGSWMLPEAKSEDLLYVSTSAGPVNVYNYKSRSQVGTLTGFQSPQGQCVDKAGDVWITDLDAKAVVEYAHGGTSPLRILGTNGNPIGCAVARNGDLAVANGVLGIEVFKRASSNGTTHKSDRCQSVWTPGYDPNGNRYFEAKRYSRYSYKVDVCELAAGSSKIKRVTFNHPITGIGSVMWDGKYIALTNTTNAIHTYVYQASEASSSGALTLAGTTEIVDGGCTYTEAPQTFIVGKKNTPINSEEGTQILGGIRRCYNDFDEWAYPRGGKDNWTLSVRFGIGESVSLAPY